MAVMEYPQREKFFAMKFVRLLTKAVAAQDLGPEVCWLLAIIASTEDAKRYRGAVSYYNEQLAPLCGFSVWQLIRNRKKAIDLGWLHYTPSSKRKAGRYWVLIPSHLVGVPDSAVDESDVNGSLAPVQNHPQGNGVLIGADAKPSARNPQGKRQTILPNPNPNPKDPDPEEDCSEQISEPPVLTFPCNGRIKQWPLSQAQVSRFGELYPAVRILEECRAALGWCEGNPTKRKTSSGMLRFLHRWLAKEQNKASALGDSSPTRKQRPSTARFLTKEFSP